MPDPWSAHPAATRAAVGCASFAVALATARKIAGRRASARESTMERGHGAWILLALAGIVIAFAAPGAAYVLLLPSAAAALAGLALRRATFLAIVFPLAVASVLWMPLLLGMELAFEFHRPIAPLSMGVP